MPLLAGFLLLLLTACGQPAQTSTPDPTSTATAAATATTTQAGPAGSPTPAIGGTVRLWLDWNPAELEALESVINSYRQIHPGTKFELIYLPSDRLRPAFETAAANGEGPSLLVGPSSWGLVMHEAGLLRDVGPLVLPELADAVHRLAWQQVALGDLVAGLPFELRGTVLYRNTLIAAQPADTVEALLNEAAEARLTGLAGAVLDLGFDRAAPFLHTCKGQLVTDERVDPIERPAGLCWLRLLDRLGSAGRPTLNTDEDRQAFAAGDSVWLIDSTEAMNELMTALGEGAIAIDRWPLYEATGEALSGYVWTENLYFPAAASDGDFEAAWSFAVYLLSPEVQRRLSENPAVRHLPVIPAVEPADALLLQAARAFDMGQRLPDPRPLEDIVPHLSTAIRLVVSQGGDPELALELALEEIRKARIPTATPTRTPAPTLTPTTTPTAPPTPPPG